MTRVVFLNEEGIVYQWDVFALQAVVVVRACVSLSLCVCVASWDLRVRERCKKADADVGEER